MCVSCDANVYLPIIKRHIGLLVNVSMVVAYNVFTCRYLCMTLDLLLSEKKNLVTILIHLMIFESSQVL